MWFPNLETISEISETEMEASKPDDGALGGASGGGRTTNQSETSESRRGMSVDGRSIDRSDARSTDQCGATTTNQGDADNIDQGDAPDSASDSSSVVTAVETSFFSWGPERRGFMPSLQFTEVSRLESNRLIAPLCCISYNLNSSLPSTTPSSMPQSLCNLIFI